ncbi:T9SS type A sorting domain-containing protein [Saccharicrinis sp. FJH62]|uniref:T9SS type A sorting domain-containing protein n=1 Tax=Saccharicrinis sp. FJH62 TaxID=3344657 RepID=UPI0035D4F255
MKKLFTLSLLFLCLCHLDINAQDEWTVNPANFQNTMTITCMARYDWAVVNDSVTIAAFVEGECRGVKESVYIPEVNKHEVFLMVYSNTQNEKVNFKVYFKKMNQTVDIMDTVVFTSNAIIGNYNSPKIWRTETNLAVESINFETVTLYPNPVHRELKISNGQPIREIIIYSLNGEELIRDKAGNKTVDVSTLNPGIYFCKLSDGKNAVVKRFMKK